MTSPTAESAHNTIQENLLVEALIDAQAYRALARQAIHVLHQNHRERARHQQTIARLRNETRRLREQGVQDGEVEV